MTHLYDVVDHDELLLGLLDGYIREQNHPDFPELRILNYTEKAQFERAWNATIKTCRGLIYNADTFEVLARPFQKIHNWDEPEAPGIEWDAPLFNYSNKFDGSLGIMYRLPDGRPALATRGSFASEQAIHGTETLRASGMMYVYDEWIDSGYTPLFEIIYPENRIVLDYGQQDVVVHLGKVHIETGKYLPAGPSQPLSFRDIVTDLSRPNKEGWVAWLSDSKAVKIKQPDYVELHRVVTGLNRKSVWKAMQDGPDAFDTWAAVLPDELWDWVLEVRAELYAAYAERVREIDDLYVRVLESVDAIGDNDRKVFAAEAKRIAGKDVSYMFTILDGKDIQTKVWAELEPRGDER